MPSKKDPDLSAELPTRWTLIKDIISFQIKLVVDGFRDFILVPVSLVVGIISLLKPGGPGLGFYSLLRAGRNSERFINLFSAADKLESLPEEERPTDDIDTMINKLESIAVNEYRNGEISKQAKEHVEQLLKSMRSRGQ